MSCICEKLNNENEILLDQGHWNNIYLEKYDDEYYIKALSDGIARVKIKYCPFCGKRLNEVSE